MKLDFTGLINDAKEGPGKPVESFYTIERTNTAQMQQKPLEGLYDALISNGLIKKETTEQKTAETQQIDLLQEFKSKYNKLLQREKKAEKYLNEATEEELEKWIPAYNNIVKDLSFMIDEYKNITLKEMDKEEILKGFNTQDTQ